MMPRIPSTHVALGDAVIQATWAWYGEEINAAGVSKEEATTFFRWQFAKAKLATFKVDRPRGVPVVASQMDLRIAIKTQDVEALGLKLGELSTLPDDAYGRLRDHLATGSIKGAIILDDGRIVPLAPHSWNGEDSDTAHQRGRMRIRGLAEYLTGVAVLPREDLERVLTDQIAPVTHVENALTYGPRNRTGRDKQFDNEAFLIEAFRLLFEGLVPSTQTELRGKALEAFSAKLPADGGPSDEWAKPIIRKLWNGLELDRKR